MLRLKSQMWVSCHRLQARYITIHIYIQIQLHATKKQKRFNVLEL